MITLFTNNDGLPAEPNLYGRAHPSLPSIFWSLLDRPEPYNCHFWPYYHTCMLLAKCVDFWRQVIVRRRLNHGS